MPAPRLVIFNADDFGLTDGVCRGIHEAMIGGVVSSTTAMVCTTGAQDRIARWAPPLAGRIGVHLQLTQGRCCSPAESIRSLVNADGEFPGSAAEVARPDPSHIRAEWSAQVDRLRRWGVEPSHLDSHHHIAVGPDIVESYVEVAKAAGLPARATSLELAKMLRAQGVGGADLCITGWYDRDLSAKALLRLVEAGFNRLGGQGMLEVTCHPAYADAELAAKSVYVRQRERELSVLTSSQLMKGLRRLDVELASIGSLAAPAGRAS